jgi:hypothetical protein
MKKRDIQEFKCTRMMYWICPYSNIDIWAF